MNLRNTSKTIASFTIKLVTCLIIAALLFVFSTKSFEFGGKVFTDKGYEEAPGKNISVTISAMDMNYNSITPAVSIVRGETKSIRVSTSLIAQTSVMVMWTSYPLIPAIWN